MKLILGLLLCFLSGCAHRPLKSTLSHLEQEGYYLVGGCGIYDVKGNLVRSYPGLYCHFHADGRLLSYDPQRLELTLYSPAMKKLWSKNLHVHHGIELTQEGYYLINSSVIKPQGRMKKVRFDEILLMNQQGETVKKFSFYDKKETIPVYKISHPYLVQWDENFDFKAEFTHVAASRQLPFDLYVNDQKVAPKGSYLITMNSFNGGAYVLDPNLEEILYFNNFLRLRIFHDISPYSRDEIIYLSNNAFINPKSDEEEARIEIFSLSQNRRVKAFQIGLYALFAGGIQVVNPKLWVITDSGSKFGSPATEEEIRYNYKRSANKKLKSRIIFYNPESEERSELHFDSIILRAHLKKVDSFLQNNIGI